MQHLNISMFQQKNGANPHSIECPADFSSRKQFLGDNISNIARMYVIMATTKWISLCTNQTVSFGNFFRLRFKEIKNCKKMRI